MALTGNFVVSGSLASAAPPGGAGAWKLGKYVGGSFPAATGVVAITIDGVSYNLLAAA
jgi:hypothetical protein